MIYENNKKPNILFSRHTLAAAVPRDSNKKRSQMKSQKLVFREQVIQPQKNYTQERW